MEDSDAKTEAPAFVYDTLPPLSFSDSNQSPPPTHEESHQYSVFRKEISDFPDDTTPVESATVDFFSLDVEGETTENGVEPVTPVVVASKKKSKKRKKDEEPRLESNWFSENSFSKIPMLQLHKEIVDFCDFLLPTQAEKAERDAAVESVSSVIKYIWPSCKVQTLETSVSLSEYCSILGNCNL
jgi:non-canonical poly(A) RNA polymerase PAPD5/7